jgi:predicted Zn-dependent protease
MRSILFAGVLLVVPALLSAQSPERPQLPPGADANDPSEYMRLGEANLERDPRKAQDAFVWATRLAPNSADAWHGRWVSYLLAHPAKLDSWMRGDRRAMKSKELIAVDSIRLAIHGMNPFYFGRYDRLLFKTYIDRGLQRSLGPAYEEARAEIEFHMENYLHQQGPEMSGWLAYTQRQFPEALDLYTRALKRTNDRAGVHWRRAELFFHLGRTDSAVASMQAAVTERGAQNEDKLTHIYESQASYEFGIGWLHEQKRDPAQAKEAYARALMSELSYYPAQLRLGELALLSHDTATALTAFATAVDLRPGDVWVRSVHGFALFHAGQIEEAVAELTRATELEPLFAAPYYYLARAAEAGNRAADAAALYARFLERASKRDTNRVAAETRLRQLTGT